MIAADPGEIHISSGTGFSREGGISDDAYVENVPASSRLKQVPHESRIDFQSKIFVAPDETFK